MIILGHFLKFSDACLFISKLKGVSKTRTHACQNRLKIMNLFPWNVLLVFAVDSMFANALAVPMNLTTDSINIVTEDNLVKLYYGGLYFCYYFAR